jgi:hypothetical protein
MQQAQFLGHLLEITEADITLARARRTVATLSAVNGLNFRQALHQIHRLRDMMTAIGIGLI